MIQNYFTEQQLGQYIVDNLPSDERGRQILSEQIDEWTARADSSEVEELRSDLEIKKERIEELEEELDELR